MTWYYKGELFEPTEEELKQYAGFVYVITEIDTGKMYIGKKTFWSKKTMKPLKGKTRKRRSIVISDWMDYYGSSGEVISLLEKNGSDHFKREILHLCNNKGVMSYLEAKEQFDRNVLLDDNYYNGIINCRVHRSHVKALRDDAILHEKGVYK